MRFIIIVIWSLCNWVMRTTPHLVLASGITTWLLLLLLVANLDVCQMVVIIAIYCASHTVRYHTLLNSPLVGTDQLALGSIMVLLFMQGVSSNLNLSSVKSNLSWAMSSVLL